MMARKPPEDSVRFEVESAPPDKEANEQALLDKCAEFFGHRNFEHQGFRHSVDAGDGYEVLRSFVIAYDGTPYSR